MTLYFVRVGHSGPIKIGYTRRFAFERLGNLQCASPWPLTIIGQIEGSETQEEHLHEALAEHRMLGEWFAPNDRVIEVVAQVLAESYPWGDVDTSDDKNPLRVALARDVGLQMAVVAVGGVTELARRMGMSRAGIYRWKHVPMDYILKVEQVTGIGREHLRPEMFRRYTRISETSKTS